ncbi:putative sulfoacetate--CoA ligase [Roseobacter fucihabitans]|uniref:Sulfoacetate--CoA ligase n=1 Tax=Roseobacter fucihabitans TaxID=1537242 RepID=A0ABZ2BR07_9RHOB|nr:AMP-binding protein [Roseobacter litoralis]MBC6966710.1 putative sulfoacetate--CoA ligase [Roseobacter litoralis]
MKLRRDASPAGTVRDWIDARAAQRGTAYVFADGAAPLDWAQLQHEARSVAMALTAQGAQKGESVAILHPNGRAGVLAVFGALYGGFRATLINLAAGKSAISYALEHSEAKLALVHDSVADLFEATRPHTLRRFDPAAQPAQNDLHDLGADDAALLMYTSGTTGRPKGVVHTHASLLAGGWTTAIAHELTPQDRALCVLPMCHINGLCVTMMAPLVSGGSVAMCARFSAGQFWDQARDFKVTWFSVVPTIISHLLHGDGTPDPDTQGRLRFGRSASAPLAPDVQRAFEKRFGVAIVETMGLTETAAQILSNPLPPGVRKIGSPGVAFGNEVEILSRGGQVCPVGTEGEIAVRGPNVMAGYLKNPEATRESFAGAWLLTGDLGRKDVDGYLFVTGRLKELIIKGGENIAPREIDEALYSHGDVVEAAAFARPCKTYGERIEAAVRVKEGSGVTGQMLVEICIERLGAFKSPEQVHFLAELPKGASGKIQRMKLPDLV